MSEAPPHPSLNIQRRKDIREVLDIKDEEAFLVYRGL